MKHVKKIISAAALLAALTLSGCAIPAAGNEITDEDVTEEETDRIEEQTPEVIVPATKPKAQTALYIKVTADGVNLRSGAGSSYSSLGTAERDTLYAYLDTVGEWYETYYKNKKVYINKNYCVFVEMEKADDAIEKVVAEGTKCLGVTYVYGATRYHDGTGRLLSGFKKSAFDCSSLMQYMFKLGAGVNLQVNTRTQIAQGKTVKKSELKRGDLMFFTNASRKNNKGIERVGHVAMYLGDNMILHTASDYAKIEKISPLRWSYYIQAQRMV